MMEGVGSLFFFAATSCRNLRFTDRLSFEPLEQAGRETAEQMATDALIIEDEPLIALELQSLVQDLGTAFMAWREPREGQSRPFAHRGRD
jgi:hypothetical protein